MAWEQAVGLTADLSLSATPLTLQQQLASIPKLLNGYQVTVQLADGTYNMSLDLRGFSGGRIHLKGNAADFNKGTSKSVIIDASSETTPAAINIQSCPGIEIHIQGIQAKFNSAAGKAGIRAGYGSNVVKFEQGCLFGNGTGGGQAGIAFSGSKIQALSNYLSNCAIGLYGSTNSGIYSFDNSSTATLPLTGLQAGYEARIAKNGAQPAASGTAENVLPGGRIL